MVKLSTTEEICLSPKCFKKMRNLKFFINVNGRFCGKVEYLPRQLRILEWPEYPFQSLPSNFNMKKLVQLNMRGSRISCLGKEFKHLQNLKSMNFRGCKFLTEIPNLFGCPNLERMDLSCCTSLVSVHLSHLRNLKSMNCTQCKFLTEIPNVSGCPNLEWMDLSWCRSLVEVHPSYGFLEKLVHLNFYGCSNLVKLPRKVNWRSLLHLKLGFCRSLESFPEIVGEMKCLTELDLEGCSAIKELPSSIRHLINLENLSLDECENFTNLPCSIYELQKLKWVSFNRCPKLITFPNKDDSQVLPTHSKVSHDKCDDSSSETESDDEGCSSLEPDNFAFPSLQNFNAGGCNLSNIDFLASFGCASTLNELDLSSGNTFVILPKCINKFVNLCKLDLRDCRRLVEIPKLPPMIGELNVSNCISLERISKLSNILERKESQMIEMDLTNCWRLCQNLVQMAKKEDVFVNDNEVDADFFSLFLSSQQSKFTVRFPGRAQVPKWFSCQMDFKGYQWCEFSIEILPNFKWENTGLALCVVVVDQKLQNTSTVGSFSHLIDINHEGNVSSSLSEHVDSEGSDHVWLHYFPFLEIGYMRPLPPFMCRVIIFQSGYFETSLKSCGVHLVMPSNEDVCMKLSHAENFRSGLPRDYFTRRIQNEMAGEQSGAKQGPENGDFWENYRSKYRTDC